MNEGEIKKMIPPECINSKSGLKPINYLIQHTCDNYLIHREISTEEEKGYKENDIFVYEGTKYLACIANCPSVSHAELAVNSYWNAIKQLNAM
ncbi:hypothetical protein [Streptomyces sp. NPDC057131]|uniref:hypothetical protein n=1 Tax=Streptomyces sp. NPDC057131 TaxID=3346027 RepID=UPI0036D426CD